MIFKSIADSLKGLSFKLETDSNSDIVCQDSLGNSILLLDIDQLQKVADYNPNCSYHEILVGQSDLCCNFKVGNAGIKHLINFCAAHVCENCEHESKGCLIFQDGCGLVQDITALKSILQSGGAEYRDLSYLLTRTRKEVMDHIFGGDDYV